MELRELVSVEALRLCEEVQQRVWGTAPEVTTASLRAAVHAGALVAGALENGKLLGFAYGFPSFVGGRVGLHSHMLAVLPEARGRGLGQALKWFQRDWCLAHGIELVTWTFDPLRAPNARLNLEHLGASVAHYYPDFYGTLGDALSGDLPSDRVVAEWVLASARVAALAAGERPEVTERPEVAGLTVVADGEPQLGDVQAGDIQIGDVQLGEAQAAARVWLELPLHIDPAHDFDRVLRWRLALRVVMVPLLSAGYRATRFVAGGYVLERPT
jgi:chorismate synthase